MHETPADLERLQELLDRSMAGAGPHLRSIITDDRRMTAREVCDHLQGMCLLVLATVTADGRPLAGPVDGIFYRGAFHFSSSSDSVRFAHIERRPWVSATHLPREELAVTVHGRAAWVDHHDPEHAAFRQTLLDIYTPRYGDDWESFLEGIPAYVRIEADRMFTLLMR
jgi:nitroimidazol reductase NimA-like FMN-containing flavoprotein (pyridoxamine 5'-phosphate oxidase superfamily)